MHFKERQYASALYYTMVGMWPLDVLCCLSFLELITHKTFSLAPTLVTALPTLAALAAMHMDVLVSETHLDVWAGWYNRKSVALADIMSTSVVEWDLLARGPMWHNGKAVQFYRPANNRCNLKGVFITTETDCWVIVSKKPEALHEAIEKARGACANHADSAGEAGPSRAIQTGAR